MDADNRLIPLVDDDQGEGIKDLVEDYGPAEYLQRLLKLQENPGVKTQHDVNEALRMILDVLNGLATKIDLIFAGHALINGQWIDITKKVLGSTDMRGKKNG